MGELFATGLQQFSHYGTEVVGLSPTQLKKARAQYLKLVGSAAKSASSAIALAALGEPLWRHA